MRNYVIMIVGATLLGAMADIVSPEKWRKYISVITGFIIISCIISPIGDIIGADVFTAFDEYAVKEQNYEEIQLKKVKEETQRNIALDIKERLKNEFNFEADVKVELGLNQEGKIDGVDKIILNKAITYTATQRICEIYGVSKEAVFVYE